MTHASQPNFLITFQCDHQHKSAANLLNHINGVHLKQNMKCVWCDFNTLNSNTLNDHSSKKHQYEKKQCIVPGCKYKTIQVWTITLGYFYAFSSTLRQRNTNLFRNLQQLPRLGLGRLKCLLSS